MRERGVVLIFSGPAIALQLGHRQSVDFDLFTDRKLNESAILRNMPFLKRAQVIQASACPIKITGTLQIMTATTGEAS
ncbi:hypothetical protein C3R74_07500 [Acidithiobacillus ferridurans]|jgi:hypothetical protein|uniref:Uncharacterized protein n=1 Tax=Acidithiobacillus ferrooxidans TaxID=920 RepID=A0A2W1K0U9_ACIFR|nr:hypothetical protein Lferr_1407 [Acidithiobacillus ferrooxidans ATCC 53993]PZD80209.1 hypothetical protein DN052_13745 [Acidithiobacillus ferrooxidans]RBM00776.1 hypothetical protein C3R74_07500 [Acidithiobacillus ferridurans]